MAKIYDVSRGGVAHNYGMLGGCSVDEDTGLPPFLQPEQRDGYQFRDKITWSHIAHELDRRYNIGVTDLEVGDRIRLFLQPNHSKLQSFFVDFRQPVKGFNFEIKSANGADYSPNTPESYKSTYTKCGIVTDVERGAVFDPSQATANTQFVALYERGSYNAKVDAVEIEITAMPPVVADLLEMELQFGRRYTQEGYMMPSIM